MLLVAFDDLVLFVFIFAVFFFVLGLAAKERRYKKTGAALFGSWVVLAAVMSVFVFS